MQNRGVVLLSVLTLALLVFVACGSGRVAGGVAMSDTRKNVAGAEGMFQRGETSARVEEKAQENALEFRKVEVADFKAGTRNVVKVTQESDQPFYAYIFLPAAKNAQGQVVVVKRQDDTVKGVLGFDCSGIRVFLEQGGQDDFGSEACPA